MRPAVTASPVCGERARWGPGGAGPSGNAASPATAKTHVSRTMIKIGARDRAQLVVLAYETGLVRPGWARQKACVSRRGSTW
jgi:hypothetical protein